MIRVCCALFSLVFSITTLAQQSPSQMVNHISERQDTVAEGYELVPGITYAASGRIELKADLYLPKGTGSFAGAVLIHGGGWLNGDRKQLQSQAAFLAAHGVVGMAIEYRLAGQAKYPAALDDSREAVRWLRRNASKYHVDPNRIFAVGSSAGGHLAALLGTYPGDSESRIAAVVAFNPVLDLTQMQHQKKMIESFLGKSCDEALDLCKQASPVFHVSSTSVPFLILHGTADQTVPYQQAVQMVAALKSADVQAELFTAEDGPHTFWAKELWRQAAIEAMGRFLQHQGLASVTEK